MINRSHEVTMAYQQLWIMHGLVSLVDHACRGKTMLTMLITRVRLRLSR